MKLLFTFFLIVSCAQNPVKKRPVWIAEPSSECSRNHEFCAVGEGKSRTKAEAQARNNLSKILSVQVSSYLQQNQSQINHELQESLTEEVQESTQASLEGVEVKKSWEEKERFWALASLQRRPLAQELGEELKEWDVRLQNLWKQGTRASLYQVEKLWEKRQTLHEKWAFFAGRRQALTPSLAEILNKRREFFQHPIPVAFHWKGSAVSLKAMVADLLSQMGYALLPKGPTQKIRGEVKMKQMYLNVPGFKRYEVSLELMALSLKRTKSLVERFYANGRSQKQAIERLLPEIKTYLEEHLTQLNL